MAKGVIKMGAADSAVSRQSFRPSESGQPALALQVQRPGSFASAAHVAGDVIYPHGAMIAVIFEVEPAEGGYDAYLEHSARLRPMLDQMDGFISIERFQSLTDPGKLVSLSFWRDESSVRAWREHPEHRATRCRGRARRSSSGPGPAALRACRRGNR
jgi:heme-degrading monooxygenase HmoA